MVKSVWRHKVLRYKTSVACILLSMYSGCAAEEATAQQRETDHVWESFPLSRCGDPILLPVTVDGEVKPFLLASNSAVHLFDVSLQNLVGPAVGSGVAVDGGGAHVQLSEVVSPRLFVGTVSVPTRTDRPSLLFDFGPIRQGLEQDVRGALAASFFRDKLVQIDFDQCVLRLATRDVPIADLGAPLPLTLDDNEVPWMEGVEVGGRQESFMVSTGSNGTTELHKWLFDALVNEGHLTIEEGESKGESVAGPVAARRGWVDTFSCGQFHHRDLLVRAGGQNALGLGYLSRYIVTIDATGGRVYLRPGKQFNRPDNVDRTGLEVRRISSALEVTSVMKGTSADVAGLEPGDKILEVNGTSCQHMRLIELNQRLCDSAGQTLTLTVDRQGTHVDVTFDVPDARRGQGSRKSMPGRE